MATKPGNTRVTFGNHWTGFDGRDFEQGKTYSVPDDLARHLLALGKVRRADDEPEPFAVVVDTTTDQGTTDQGASTSADK